MSIFSDTILKAIADYRLLLRRYLPQVERVKKLNALDLRRPYNEDNEIDLYQVGYNIVRDIKANLSDHSRGYYAYSGTRRFGEYLEEFLDQYDILDDEVIHKAQQACRSILLSLQLVDIPQENFDDLTMKRFKRCNKMVAFYATEEQKDNYNQILSSLNLESPDLYKTLASDYEHHLDEGISSAVAA